MKPIKNKKEIAKSIALDYLYGSTLFGYRQKAKQYGVSTYLVSKAIDKQRILKPLGEIKPNR